MSDSATGEGAQNTPPAGSGEWAPGAAPQFPEAPEEPPEPEGPRVVSQPGGPDMIQVPRANPEQGQVPQQVAQQPAAPPPVAQRPVAPPPVAQQPVAPPPVAQRPVAPPPVYAQYAPPAYQPPVPPQRKGVPWWVWLIIGGVVLVGVLSTAAAVLVFQQLNKGHSPDYTGAPVTPTEQPTTAGPTPSTAPTQPGANTVISASGAVAFDVPSEWVNAGDYIDLSSMEAPLADGQDILGTYFTGDPNVVTPQLVVVLESSPSLSNKGTYDDQLDQYLAGFATSAQSVSEATRTPVTTANGLEGLQGDFTATYDGVEVPVRTTILGNGNRLVFVQWISYSGPIDDAAYNAFVDTLRIDP